MTAAVCTCCAEDPLAAGPGIPVSYLPALEAACSVHGVVELAAAPMETPEHFTGWRTPPDKFLELHAEFAFNVDAAADDENALMKPHDLRRQHGSHKPVTPCEIGGWCGYCGGGPLERYNTLIGRYYTVETNGLLAEHYQPGDRVFCNPPYTPTAQLYAWVRLAATTAKLGVLWVMVLPPSIDVAWFHDFLWDAELHRWRDRVEGRFPRGRWRFNGPEGKVSPPKGNLIAVLRPPLECAK